MTTQFLINFSDEILKYNYDAMEQEIKCTECALRANYDTKPRSFAGRFWRWHINFCPGWKAYMASLDKEKKNEVAKTYGLRKYLA